MPYPDRCASRAVVARGSGPVCAIVVPAVVPAVVVSSGPVCAGMIAVPMSSCCASQGAVVAVAAVAAAGAGCPAKGQYLSRKLKKFGRTGHKHNHRQHLPTGLTFGGVSHSRKFNGKNRP